MLVVCLLFTANFMMAGMGVVIVALLLPAIGTLREMGEVSTHIHIGKPQGPMARPEALRSPFPRAALEPRQVLNCEVTLCACGIV